MTDPTRPLTAAGEALHARVCFLARPHGCMVMDTIRAIEDEAHARAIAVLGNLPSTAGVAGLVEALEDIEDRYLSDDNIRPGDFYQWAAHKALSALADYRSIAALAATPPACPSCGMGPVGHSPFCRADHPVLLVGGRPECICAVTGPAGGGHPNIDCPYHVPTP